MVTLPKGFVATKWAGYFWHMEEKHLYSIKMQGELVKLKHCNGAVTKYRRSIPSGYQVSVKGTRRLMTDAYLETLTYPTYDQEIGVGVRAERRPPHKEYIPSKVYKCTHCGTENKIPQ